MDGLDYAQNQRLATEKKNAETSPQKKAESTKNKKDSQKLQQQQQPKGPKRRDLESALTYVSLLHIIFLLLILKPWFDIKWYIN